MKITFLGAVGQVTGSKYLVEQGSAKILVDCGLIQGGHENSQHNWDPFPVDPKSIDAIVITHAHLDHTGYIPLLVKNGFAGKIYCSKATAALCAIILTDSGALQEQNARHRKEGDPQAVPLYTVVDVQNALKYFHAIDYDTVVTIGQTLTATLISSHHILGSAFVIISNGTKKLTFTGDLGRPEQLIMRAPPHLTQTDFLVLESTYGDRLHEQSDPMQELSDIVNATVKKGGVLVMPAFAVERTQVILYCLYQLKQKNRIPAIPIFLDSPMAIRVTNLFCEFKDEHILPTSLCKDLLGVATFTSTVEESQQIDHMNQPAIIIAGSGMADGGRVLYHLKRYISDAKNSIVVVGFQAKGTPGRALVEGAKNIKIQGTWLPVKAEIKTVHALSAHADYQEILQWLGYFEQAPKKVFITHGEKDAAASLKEKIEERFGWSVVTPTYLETFDLD